MNDIRDHGERFRDGRRHRRAVERRAFGNALVATAVFGGVILVNGVLFILMLAFVGALGGGRGFPT